MKRIWIMLARFCLRRAGWSKYDLDKSLEDVMGLYDQRQRRNS